MLCILLVFADCDFSRRVGSHIFVPTPWCIVIWGVLALIAVSAIVNVVVQTWFPKLMTVDLFAWLKRDKGGPQPLKSWGSAALSPWAVLDRIVIGDHSLNVETTLPFPEAQSRLQAASDPEPSDSEMPYLVVDASRNFVFAYYGLQFSNAVHGPETLRNLMVVRPVFRGLLLENHGAVRLQGRFGVNFLVRMLALASLVALLASLAMPHTNFPLPFATVAVVMFLAFVLMCILTRVNGDDILYISRNLEYALLGDSPEKQKFG